MRPWLVLSSLALAALATPASAASPTVDGVTLIINQPVKAYDSEAMTSCRNEVCSSVVQLIDGAQETLDFAIYGVRDQPAVMAALERAQKRGVRIRGVVDKDTDNVNYYTSTPELESMLGTVRDDYETDLRTLDKRRSRGAFDYEPPCLRPVGFDGPVQCLGYELDNNQCLVSAHASKESLDDAFKGEIMHHKFFVADNKSVWMGSTNVSNSGTGGYNANLVVVIRNPTVAQWYTDEFNQMWDDGLFHREKKRLPPWKKSIRLGDDMAIDVLFSPQDDPMDKGVRPLLQNAKKSIDIAVFYLTNKYVTRDLIEAHKRGVKVRVILDATAARNGYTKHALLRAAGIPVKVENWGGKMHMKSAVIDGAHIVTGSMNWTSAGDANNDENTALLHSKELARHYQEQFEIMWKDIPDEWLQGRPKAEGIHSPAACVDGFDNDYDHLADDEDPACQGPYELPPLPPHRIVPKLAGSDLVKGVTDRDGKKTYFTITSRYYNRDADGVEWFCSELEAKDAGYRRSRQ